MTGKTLMVCYTTKAPYVLEIILTKLISKHHDNKLASHFDIEKTQELEARKYY